MLFSSNGKTYVVKFRYDHDLNNVGDNVMLPVTIANCFLHEPGADPKARKAVCSGWSICAPEDVPRFSRAVGRWFAVKRMIRSAYELGVAEKTEEFARNAITALRTQTKVPSKSQISQINGK